MGGAIGLLSTTALALISGGIQRNAQVQVGTAPFGQATFSIDDSTRKVAWHLFLETMTRVTTQPLGAEEGFLREALNSLHNLFGATRDLLKEMNPSQVTEGKTVEMLAIAMLNKELRPFLSKWHPLLTTYEAQDPENQDRDWDKNEEFRVELENLRQRMFEYARSFGELAEVSQLEDLIADTTYNKAR
jgi:hypothetical protein